MSEWLEWVDTLDVLGWWLLASLVVGLLASIVLSGGKREDVE
jgi:hypothetical protein